MSLELRSITSGYGKLTIVHDVDLTVDAGEIVLIMGPNGAGKTTLLRTISGHLPIQSGQIVLGGSDIGSRSAYERADLGIGYVPQEGNVFRSLTVAENLSAPTLFKPELAEGIGKITTRFPRLAERSSQLASTLSGGERQMLAVGSAMVAGPRMLLLDEPTAGLAPRFVDEIVRWMSDITSQGCGVLWVVEQNPEAVIEAASRVYFMAGGEITDEQPAASLHDVDLLRKVLFDG